jgi:DNA polymerase III subunit delta'
MANLVFHPSTELELKQFQQRPAHAAILVGSEGMGKMAVARQLSADVLKLPTTEALDNYPYFHVIMPVTQSISIEQIRELFGLTKLKISNAADGMKRIIVIDDSQTMTMEAQNALLKLLEEPPEGTLFILNASNLHGLLPTVRSRAQQLHIKQPSQSVLEQHFTTLGFDAQKVHSFYLMSGGLPGLLHALLHEREEHPLMKAVEQARAILRASTFERLTMVDALSKQKIESIRLLFVLQQMAHVAITQAAGKKTSSQSIKQWHRVLSAAYDAQTALLESTQAKLVFTHLMLSL